MKYIAIRQEPNGSLYMDKDFFNHYKDEDLERYNYTKVEIPEEIFDKIHILDFDITTLRFDRTKFDARKEKEKSIIRIEELKNLLREYDYIGTKIATGRGTREQYATQIAQMTEWAEEIDRLEAKINGN